MVNLLKPCRGDRNHHRAESRPTFAKEAAVAAKFIAHELPADFVKNLEDDRKAIDAGEDAVEGDDNEGVVSTAAVGRLIRDDMKEAVKKRLSIARGIT